MEEINKKYCNYQRLYIEDGRDNVGLISGINNELDFTPHPKHIQTSAEKVIEGPTAARIVLGKDRNEGIESGYGGRGDSHCSAIDIVVEPVSALYDPKSEKQYCNPNFQYDSARIYISGKANIDSYFGVPDSENLSKGRSAVALFSDCTRIFARQDIRIVSGMSGKNARGGNIYESYNIQLVGNNDFSKLQPAVLGDNLVSLQKEMIDVIDGMLSMIDNIVNLQTEYNKILSEHVHYSPFFGKPTTPSEKTLLVFSNVIPKMLAETKTSILSLRNKLASMSNNYLSGVGGSSILSDYVELN